MNTENKFNSRIVIFVSLIAILLIFASCSEDECEKLMDACERCEEPEKTSCFDTAQSGDGEICELASEGLNCVLSQVKACEPGTCADSEGLEGYRVCNNFGQWSEIDRSVDSECYCLEENIICNVPK